jgi:hypothetical protein
LSDTPAVDQPAIAVIRFGFYRLDCKMHPAVTACG